MSDNCIFCKIANKEIPSQFVYEDDMVVAFKDLEPQGPVHVLVIPKKHIASLLDTTDEDKALLAHITCDVIPQLAKKLNVAEKGFRTVVNTGERRRSNSTAPSFPYHWWPLHAMASRLIKNRLNILQCSS